LSKFDEKTKKEYFKKFIIEPLSDSLPFSQLFNNSFEDNIFSENLDSFANYIDFNIGDTDLNKKENKISAKKTKAKEEIAKAEISNEPLDMQIFDDNFDNPNFNLSSSDNTLLNDVFGLQRINNEFNTEIVEFDEEYLNSLTKNFIFRSPHLKLDEDIHWKIEIPNYNINKNSLKANYTNSQNHSKMCEDAVIRI